jgi:hypothetical protein
MLRAVGICAGLASLAACVPPFSELQSARLVGPGRTEITPSYSAVFLGEEGHVQDDLGVQAGFGIAKPIDLRLRYEMLIADGALLHAVGVGPKLRVLPDRVALFVPIGFGFGEDVETSETVQVHPTMLLTWPASPTFELNASAKVLVPLAGDQDTGVAFNLGPGLSSDLRRWAARPEIGVLLDPADSDVVYVHVSFGVTFFAE